MRKKTALTVSPPRLQVAVLGSSAGEEGSDRWQKAFRVGRRVAMSGGVLLTGGCTGLPLAAVQGAHETGGLTIAVSPAMNREEHLLVYGYPDTSLVTVYTGMGRKGRNVILVRSADACIFVGGGMGTLNEFTIAFDELGPQATIGILRGSGGLSEEIPRLIVSVGRTSRARILEEWDPDRLVEAIFHEFPATPGDVVQPA